MKMRTRVNVNGVETRYWAHQKLWDASNTIQTGSSIDGVGPEHIEHEGYFSLGINSLLMLVVIIHQLLLANHYQLKSSSGK